MSVTFWWHSESSVIDEVHVSSCTVTCSEEHSEIRLWQLQGRLLGDMTNSTAMKDKTV